MAIGVWRLSAAAVADPRGARGTPTPNLTASMSGFTLTAWHCTERSVASKRAVRLRYGSSCLYRKDRVAYPRGLQHENVDRDSVRGPWFDFGGRGGGGGAQLGLGDRAGGMAAARFARRGGL